jgi:hypothetical protein
MGERIKTATAHALLQARLAQIGRPAEYLDQAAADELVRSAAGSEARLKAALSSTLFLASTEDAPVITRSLVERALPPGWYEPVEPPAASTWRLALLAGGAAFLVPLIAALALKLLQPHPVPAAGQQNSTAPAAARPAATAPKPPAKASAPMLPTPALRPPGNQAAAAHPATGQPPQTSPTKPPPTTAAPNPKPPPQAGSASVPGQAVSPPPPPPAPPLSPTVAQPVLPASPPAIVTLIYQAHDEDAQRALAGLGDLLHQNGINLVVAEPETGRTQHRGVIYFFSQDQDLAQQVANLLKSSAWPRLARLSLTPRLVLQPPGSSPRRPGTIDVQLP